MNASGKTQLKVNAVELLRRPGTVKPVRVSISPEVVEIADQRLVPASSLDVDLVCESLSDGIRVHGRIGASFHGECRRCLKPLEGRIDADVEEMYQTTVTDPDAFPIENDQIDLGPVVRETVLLELPDAPLCRIDCPGLCPTCGRDLDQGPCSCPVESVDPRWSVLDSIRDQLPE